MEVTDYTIDGIRLTVLKSGLGYCIINNIYKYLQL